MVLAGSTSSGYRNRGAAVATFLSRSIVGRYLELLNVAAAASEGIADQERRTSGNEEGSTFNIDPVVFGLDRPVVCHGVLDARTKQEAASASAARASDRSNFAAAGCQRTVSGSKFCFVCSGILRLIDDYVLPGNSGCSTCRVASARLVRLEDTTAAAMRCLNGEIFARLVVRTPEDEARCKAMGITDLKRIYTAHLSS